MQSPAPCTSSYAPIRWLIDRRSRSQRGVHFVVRATVVELSDLEDEFVRPAKAKFNQLLARRTDPLRVKEFQHGRFLNSQWFPDKATSAQTNSRAPSVVLNQIDDLWSPSTFHRARDRRSSCQILACHLVAHAKLRLSCGAHPR